MMAGNCNASVDAEGVMSNLQTISSVAGTLLRESKDLTNQTLSPGFKRISLTGSLNQYAVATAIRYSMLILWL